MLAVRAQERVTWSGAHRAALVDQPVYPRPVQEPLPVWVAVGGNPQSVVRAGLLIQVAIGDVPHREVLRAIELLGTKVAPLVQAGL